MSNEGREQVSDIVERLRKNAVKGYPEEMMREAADEIEAMADLAKNLRDEQVLLRSRIAALEAELSAEKAKVAKLRKAMVEIRDRQARNILPWTHEQAADEYARMLDADRMTARRIHEETA